MLDDSFLRNPLNILPWISPKHWPHTIKTHPLIYPSLLAFHKAISSHHISSQPRPLTSLRGNPDFPPGMSNTFLLQEWPHDEVLTHHFFYKGQFRSYENLTSGSCMKSFPFWSYRQLRHFFTSKDPTDTWTRQLTPFEALYSLTTPQRHLISFIYSLLQDDTHQSQKEPAQRSWGRDMQITFTDEEWETINTYAHKGSLNVAIQENGYKIVTKWNPIPLAQIHTHNFKHMLEMQKGSGIHNPHMVGVL